MNEWTARSIEYAGQRSYLDDLFQVYPTIPEGIRDIDKVKWDKIEEAFHKRDNEKLIKRVLKLDLFPIKDSYIAYLKRDKTSIDRNPQTVNRICGRLYELGLEKIYERCTEPKETNRQIGPMFRNWVRKKSLGVQPVPLKDFLAGEDNAILDESDDKMMKFARDNLGYTHDKGLDFVGRFNKKYVIGEAKFLTDFGGHQNAQFADAVTVLESEAVNAVKVAILDGVLYIEGKNKMHKKIKHSYKNYNIMSALVFREFLYQV